MTKYFDYKEKEKIMNMLESNEIDEDDILLHDLLEKWKDDTKVMKKAILKDKISIRDVSSRLKDNKEFVMKIISEGDYVEIDDLSDRLKNDNELMFWIVENNFSYYICLPKKYKCNKEIAFLAMKKDPEYIWQYLPNELNEDKEFILSLLLNGIKISFDELPSTVTNDNDIVELYLKLYPVSFKYMPKEIKNNKTMVKTAVTNWPYAFYYASDDLKNQMEMVLFGLSADKNLFYYGPDEDYVYNEKKLEDKLFGYRLRGISKNIKADLLYVNSIYKWKTMNELCIYMLNCEELRHKAKKYIFVDVKFRFI